MNLKTNPHDWAYPSGPDQVDGLTKREYFAALALQGLCAREQVNVHEKRVEAAVRYADDLINELNKERL